MIAGLVEVVNAVELVGVKTAVIECVVAVSVVVATEVAVAVLVPVVTGIGLPRVEVPSMNCTEPAADGVTVAVNVTDVPNVVGLAGLAATVVEVVVGPEPA